MLENCFFFCFMLLAVMSGRESGNNSDSLLTYKLSCLLNLVGILPHKTAAWLVTQKSHLDVEWKAFTAVEANWWPRLHPASVNAYTIRLFHLQMSLVLRCIFSFFLWNGAITAYSSRSQEEGNHLSSRPDDPMLPLGLVDRMEIYRHGRAIGFHEPALQVYARLQIGIKYAWFFSGWFLFCQFYIATAAY